MRAALLGCLGLLSSCATLPIAREPELLALVRADRSVVAHFDWVRPRLGQSALERERWLALLEWARRLASDHGRDVRAFFASRGLPAPELSSMNCFADEACDRVLRAEYYSQDFADWAAFSAAWNAARPAVVASIEAASEAEAQIRRNAPARDFEAELRGRFAEEQHLRRLYAGGGSELPEPTRRLYKMAIGLAITQADRENAAWLARRLRAWGGWLPPSASSNTREAAWIIIIHARHDPRFQFDALDALRIASGNGSASPAYYATKADHLWTNTFGNQQFGTAGDCRDGRFVVAPVLEQPDLEERRRAVGLPSSEAQQQMMDASCSPPAR